MLPRQMHITIEFYRTQDGEDAHPLSIGQMAETADLDEAMEVARRISQMLSMPQQPDALTITAAAGAVLYADAL